MGLTRTNLAARIAAIGLGCVLCMVAGFALWAAVSSERSSAQLAEARRISDAYQQGRFALDDERLLEHQFMLGHGGDYSSKASRALHARFDTIASRADAALGQILKGGNATDRVLAKQLIAEQADYHRTTDATFAAAEMGDGSMARSRGGMADRDFEMLRDRMTAVTQQRNDRALRELLALRETQGTIRTATTLVIPLALVLFGAFALVLRAYRRREVEFTRSELARLEHQALIDNLTRLRNQRAFEEDLTTALARVDRSGEPMALVLLDLDGLKQTNDALGHQAGDERLKALADAMRSALRTADGAYRIAGDEFAIVLPNSRAIGGLEAAQRVHDALHRAGLSHASATAGVAESGPGIGRDELIRKSDLALLEAKRSRRRMLVYSPEMEGTGTRPAFDPGLVGLSTLASALARAVDAKDHHTRSHSETVAELCVLIATGLGLDPEVIGEIRLAGLLHDVGKIGIPDAILSKPTDLTEEEYTVMKGHSRIGHGIVDATGLLEQADWILHHHERMDGRGYPDGLAGDAIPLQSRIILVADAFEAMTADRPYRRGRPAQQAVSELRRHAGSQFDVACVDALEIAVAASPGPVGSLAADHELSGR